MNDQTIFVRVGLTREERRQRILAKWNGGDVLIQEYDYATNTHIQQGCVELSQSQVERLRDE